MSGVEVCLHPRFGVAIFKQLPKLDLGKTVLF
jgi:hypothetical protein